MHAVRTARAVWFEPATSTHTIWALRTQCGSHTDPSGPSITKPLPAQRLIQLFCEVQHPAYSNRRYSLAVIDFVNEAVLAYECGVTEAELQRQVAPSLTRLRDSAPPSSLLARSTADFCEQGFMRAVLIVWVTLMLSPRSVKRWAHTPAVSDEALAVWRGFISMIVSGYFERRMAWYPLDRLQLELSAVQGRATNQDQVAEYARLTYTTLEKVYPQFPAD